MICSIIAIIKYSYDCLTCSLSSTAWSLADICSSLSLKAVAVLSFSFRSMGEVFCRRDRTVQSCKTEKRKKKKYEK